MARSKITMTKGDVVTPPALTNAADWNIVSGNVRIIPAQSGETDDVWPDDDFEGIIFRHQQNEMMPSAPSERFHVRCVSDEAVIEIYEQGA